MKQINTCLLLMLITIGVSSFTIKYDDGKSYKTAIKVDCSCKEHTIIKTLGFKPKIHASQIHNNKHYDVFMNDKNDLLIFEIITKEIKTQPDSLKPQTHEIFS
jgi:hypothetical protein